MKRARHKHRRGHDQFETEAAAGQNWDRQMLDEIARRSTLICPTCKGALWEMQEGSLLRFRCHIGHAYTAEALLVDQNEEVELALSHALRALEDRADLSKRLALRAKDKKQKHNQALYESQVREAETHAAKLRQTLLALRPNERG